MSRGFIAFGLVVALLAVGCKDNPTEATDFISITSH